MPIFDFKCRACGEQFEELVRRDDVPACPDCGGEDLEKLVSVPVVSTEGSRQRTLSNARRASGKVHKEKQHAQAEYERNYIKDHS